jgi:hypothetical protein
MWASKALFDLLRPLLSAVAYHVGHLVDDGATIATITNAHFP